MVKKRNVRIKKQFETQGQEIVNYIRQSSPQSAEKFKRELEKRMDKIVENPFVYPSEPYLETKRNLYRFAILMKNWKIIFKVTNNLLIFLGIIHTARHPREIKKQRTTNYE